MENQLIEIPNNSLPQIEPPQDAMMLMIERICSNPNFNVSALQELRAMRDADIERIAKKEFAKAMEKAQREMPKIFKNKKNTQTNSNYADLEAVDGAVKPVYLKHGFSLTFGTADSTLLNHKRITCDVMHEGGYSKDYFYDLPLDNSGIKGVVNKTEVHAHGATTSYARRYLTCLIFNIATTDDKDGNLPNQIVSLTEAAEIDNLINKTKSDRKKFLAYMRVEDVRKIASKDYKKAIEALSAKNAQNVKNTKKED